MMYRFCIYSVVLLSIFCFSFIFAKNSYAQQQTFYVSPSGSDNNTGTEFSPLKTIQRAVNLAQAGTVIYVQPGTYSGQVVIKAKKGTENGHITIIGASRNPSEYPVLAGDDPGYTSTIDKPAFIIDDSSWIRIERLRIKDYGKSSIRITRSSFITIRRNIINYHQYAILASNSADVPEAASNHILIEYNEIFQNYGAKTWDEIKASKWEGGAYTSFGGGGTVEIRYNYIHDSFNGVYVYRNEKREFTFADSNVWIHDNRFERILDDPYEPDISYSYNGHFYNNVVIDSHRLVSMAASGARRIDSTGAYDNNLGPVYVYNNIKYTIRDITLQPNIRVNSAWKIALSTTALTTPSQTNHFANGIYLFNNSVDISAPNGVGADQVNTTDVGTNVNKWYHYNNVYKTTKETIPAMNLTNSASENNFGSNAIKIPNTGGAQFVDPQFTNSQGENFILKSTSPAKTKSRQISFTSGFTQSLIIPAGADAGVQMVNGCFAQLPRPRYEVPPGGEQPGYVKAEWPADNFGGANPAYQPKGCIAPVTNSSTLTPFPSSITAAPATSTPTTVNTIPTVTEMLQAWFSSGKCGTKECDLNKDSRINSMDFALLLIQLRSN